MINWKNKVTSLSDQNILRMLKIQNVFYSSFNCTIHVQLHSISVNIERLIAKISIKNKNLFFSHIIFLYYHLLSYFLRESLSWNEIDIEKYNIHGTPEKF